MVHIAIVELYRLQRDHVLSAHSQRISIVFDALYCVSILKTRYIIDNDDATCLVDTYSMTKWLNV